MTNHVKLLGALTLALVATAARAENDSSSVPKALLLNLERSDLGAFAEGLSDVFADRPIAGRFDERIEQSYWFGTVGVEGIGYSFGISDIQTTPQNGYVRAAVSVDNLEANIDILTFNDARTMYCENIPVTANGVSIPVATNARPWIDADHNFHLVVDGSEVILGSDNFAIGEPAACHTIWGFNWLVRRIIPWTSGLLRSRVAASVESAIGKVADELTEQYGALLQVGVTLPVSKPPVPPFYATVRLWPDSVVITPERFRFQVGAEVTFDPDLRLAEETESRSLVDLLPAGQLPSFLGLARDFIEHVVAEANAKGLLSFRIDRSVAPESADLLSAGVVSLMIPDAQTRFAPEAPVALAFNGATAVHTAVEPCGGPGGIPIIDFQLTGLKVGVSIDDAPYYDMSLDVHVRVAAGYSSERRRLELAFVALDAKLVTGAFASGLTPAPIDQSFSQEFLTFFVKQLNDKVKAEHSSIFSLDLPNLALGSKTVNFVGSSFRDDYLTLDAVIR